MNDKPMDEMTRLLREEYNAPPSVPREEMWSAIQGGLNARDSAVVSLDAARARRRLAIRRTVAWGTAAAAVLVVGFGLGRFTSPTTLADLPALAEPADRGVLRVAAVDHLGRTQALLQMVRADGRSGQVDPAVGAWAANLLTQTRFLLDTPENEDPAMRALLEDLELVLVQIVGVADSQDANGERARTELSLALRGLEQNNVLSRIDAVTPNGFVLAGT